MENKSKTLYTYLFGLLFPFWSIIVSLKYFKSPSARNLFWYGCVFMGFIHIFNPIGGSGSDGFRYATELVQMHNNPINWANLFTYFYSKDGNLDIYQQLITFLISLITANPHFLFLVFAFVFGFFYSRNIWMVLRLSSKDTLTWWVWLVLIGLLVVNPIWNINGVRMWTALQVFIYGILSFYTTNNKRKIIWSIVSVLIHFSFIFPVILLLVFQFLPKRSLSFYFIIFFIAASFNEINIQSFKDNLVTFLPDVLNSRVNSYMDEDYVQSVNERNQNLSLYLLISAKMTKYFQMLVLLYFWKKKNLLFSNETYCKLLTLCLFMGSFFNFFSIIPSYGRFNNITMVIFFTIILILLIDEKIKDNQLHVFVKYSSVLIILPILLAIRIGLGFYGTSLFWGNFISAVFIDDRIPVISYIKSLF